MFSRIFLLFIFCISTSVLVAQTFEIRANHPGGNIVNIDMRCTSGPCPTMSNFVLDLVFGLKWQSSYGVDLSAPGGSYNMATSDGELVSGSFEFQAYGANSTPYAFPASWPLNAWVTVASVTITPTGSGTGTFEIAEVGFNATTNPNINVDGGDFTPIINGAATNVPLDGALPSELLAFDVKAGKSTIELFWQSAAEENFKGYEIQRAVDGDHFEAIGWVDGRGGINQKEYGHTDRSVRINKDYYYRLKMLDLDGQFEFSPSRVARISSKAGKVRVYPSPVNQNGSITIENSYKERIRLLLFNSNGKVLRDLFIDGQTNLNYSLQGIPAGVLIYKMESSDRMETGQIVVQ